MDIAEPADEYEAKSHLSPEQVRERLDRLGDTDWARLRALSKSFAGITRLEPSDLLQLALEKALSGQRGWPEGLGANPFLYGVMRSLVSSEAKKRANDPLATAQNEASEVEDLPADQSETPEGSRQLADTLDKVLEIFEKDPQALDLLEGRALGLEGEELREALGLTTKDFETLSKRVRRRYLNHFLTESDDEA